MSSVNLFAKLKVRVVWRDLSAQFWISKWRVPGRIEEELYAALLCIDPNGLRSDHKGPIIFVLDSVSIKPGLSGKSGVVMAQINDNANSTFHPQQPRGDMELLEQGTCWIRDEDEFWVGFQRGPDPQGNESHGSWITNGGSDGKGLGRKWVMGGYVNDRYYKYSADTRITAAITGRCYMDVWKDVPFGLPESPRNYTVATDLATIAADVLSAVNTLQPAGYRYTARAGYWPVATGTTWLKEFRQDPASEVMQDIVDEIGYEWKIDYMKRAYLYARTASPYPSALSPAYSIRFTTNLRQISKLCMGDTTERFTHIIVTDAASMTVPPDIDGWCMNPALWPDMTNPIRGYGAAALPAPCNPKDAIYSDVSLILDDEGHPAICIQSETTPNFSLNLSFFIDAANNQKWTSLHLDLREWRRLKFRFRHPTRIVAGNIYRVQIHTALNDLYYYQFGRGAGLSPQLVAGDTDHDTVSDDQWSELDLLLPECDVNGTVTNLHGWVTVGAPDPTDVNWPRIFCALAEPSPGHGPGQALAGPALVGTEYLAVAQPELFAGMPPGAGERRFWQESVCLLQKGATSEEVRIRGTSLSSIPLPDNIELTKGILNTYNMAGPTPWLYLKGGWTICFSQFHFERNLRYEDEVAAPTPPYRYRLMVAKEMEHLNEAVARADSIVEQETETKIYARLTVDRGHPEFEIGNRVRLYLGVAPFNNVGFVIDDIEYSLGEDQDFVTELTLGTLSQRQRELNEFTVMDQHERRLENLGLGKTEMVRR